MSDMTDLDQALTEAAMMWLRWRVGRKIGRTIYAMVGDHPSNDDTLIGVMDTPRLAAEAVNAHNVVHRLRGALEIIDAGAWVPGDPGEGQPLGRVEMARIARDALAHQEGKP